MSFYKNVPYNKKVSVVRTIVRKVPKDRPMLDKANLVILGGIFEKIGDDNEAIGGGSQKVGTNNQR